MSTYKSINWSSLDRWTLYSYFYSLKSEIVGRNLAPNTLHRVISRHVKSYIPVKIKKCIDLKIQRGLIYTGGVYYSDRDKKGKTAIEVNYSYHPLDDKIKVTDYRFKRMAMRFADVVLHEMIHLRQFRSRNFKNIPGYQSTAEFAKDRKQQEYYGDRDEMGAFAFNTACELIDRFGYDPHTIKKYIDSDDAKRHTNSWWYDYLKYFNFNHNHPIIRRMKKKILRQLENAYLGKPFRTTDHLTW